MMQWTMVGFCAVLAAGPVSGASYTVTNTRSVGTGSLRWAIRQANLSPDADRILFTPTLSGRVIFLTTALPTLNGSGTVLMGDIDGDRAPDVALNGKRLSSGSGLVVRGDECVIAGLAVTAFPDWGIELEGASHCRIRSCHVGVNLPGTAAVYNGRGDIVVREGGQNRIGGLTTAARNVISSGRSDAHPDPYGILIVSSSHNTVAGNYVGVNRAGTAVLGNGSYGIELGLASQHAAAARPRPSAAVGPEALPDSCTNNTIGGTTAAERNVVAGVRYGVALRGADENVVSGNWFGLAGDGDTALAVSHSCMSVGEGAARNTIGGTTARARNVFAGGAGGIMLSGSGTENNKVQGNYFGLNAPGTRQRPLGSGVEIDDGAGAQIIGGSRAAAGNYFALQSSGAAAEVWFQGDGSGTLVRHNRFGIRPNGQDALPCDIAILARGVRVEIVDNTIARAEVGIGVMDPDGDARIFRNLIRHCEHGVMILSDARCLLGNLGNPSSRDDGGNLFRRSNTWHIRNETPHLVRAEGNDFGTTRRWRINAKIIDKRDHDALGRVDFSPLAGGVLPTGDAAPVALTAASALPTRSGGAEIVFGLSAPASVTVTILNVAGRPVATVVRDVAAEAGVQRIVWSGQTDHGTQGPGGMYLVRIQARDAVGQQAQALCRLVLAR